jgi:DNA-binding NarL/FixJ family response regulator
MIKVLVGADHKLYRAGLAALLGGEHDITVVSQVGYGASTAAEVDRTQPDVLVVDFPGLVHGRGRFRPRGSFVNGARINVPAVFLFGNGEVRTLLTALSLGARGLVSVDDPQEDVVRAVRAVSAGEAFVTPALAAPLLDQLSRQAPLSTVGESAFGNLTNRERAVLRLLAAGFTTAEIAEDLHVTRATVKSHISHMLLKLGLKDRVQAVALAYQLGLVDPVTVRQVRRTS